MKISAYFTNFRYFLHLSCALLVFECVLGILIIYKIPYTEIDWKAYMQQVQTFAGGEYDYIKLKGGTGPLVYPAGFVYFYWVLSELTNNGLNILRAQLIFLVLYVLELAVVFAIYYRTRIGPPWIIILLCLSKRMHSIFMLRLFNDPIAMLLFYAAMYSFIRQKWYLGSALYSLAVSIKMNILLFAPGLLCLYIQSSGLKQTILYLSVCAGIQLWLGAPFLHTHWMHYMKKAFEFDRVFFYKWTVNWKMLSPTLFTSKFMAIGLLLCHLTLLFRYIDRSYSVYGGLVNMVKRKISMNSEFMIVNVSSQNIAHLLFVSNFVGICFARTLHYQFYSWYFHSLPYLLWQTNLPTSIRILLFCGIEYAFNVYPSTTVSSSILQVCHGVLLAALFYQLPNYIAEDKPRFKKVHKSTLLTGMNANDRDQLMQMLNTSEAYMTQKIALHYLQLDAVALQGIRVVSVDEFEIFFHIPKKGKVIGMSFGDDAPLNSVKEVLSLLKQMESKIQPFENSASAEKTLQKESKKSLRARKKGKH